MLDQEPGQRLRGVVGGRFLAVAAGQPVDKGALLVNTCLSAVEDNLVRPEFVCSAAGHEITWREQINLVLPGHDVLIRVPYCVLFGFGICLLVILVRLQICFRLVEVLLVLFGGFFVVLIRALRAAPRLRTQLDQVLLSHDPCERDQGFVDRSKLSDTELRIRDPAGSPARLLQGEKTNNLLDRFIPQVHRVQDRRAVGIEKRNFHCGKAHRRTVALVEKRECALQAFPEVGAVLLNRGA